jgi:hypothetical protein
VEPSDLSHNWPGSFVLLFRSDESLYWYSDTRPSADLVSNGRLAVLGFFANELNSPLRNSFAQ